MALDRKAVATVNAVGGQSATAVPTLQQPQVYNDVHLPYAIAPYRGTVHESTGYSPNFLMVGHDVRSPLDVVMVLPVMCSPPGTAVHEFVNEQLDQMRAAYGAVPENLKKEAEWQKHYYDLRVKPASLHPNDSV